MINQQGGAAGGLWIKGITCLSELRLAFLADDVMPPFLPRPIVGVCHGVVILQLGSAGG